MKALIALIVACLFAPVALAQTAAPAQTVAPQQTTRVVVLRNGNVLEGQVDRLADGYRVVTGAREHRLPVRDIERITFTLLDAYAAKRIDVREGSAAGHIELAKWCIRQQIWPQAAAELADARAIDNRHPAIGYVERQLEVASRAAMRAAQMAAAPPETTAEDNLAKQAELAELEKLAAELPQGTLEQFARHIQPILVNGCAAGGCHSAGDPRELRLNRDLVRGVANRESTLRNLQAVWNSIDHQTPEYSPLLMQPAVPHGGLPRPVFGGHRQKVQEKLAEWVRTATATQPTPDAPEVELAAYDQPAAGSMPAAPAAGTPTKHFWEDPAALGLPEGAAPPTEQAPPKRGAQLKRYEPRDEFDPELFNRQHQAEEPAAEPSEGE